MIKSVNFILLAKYDTFLSFNNSNMGKDGILSSNDQLSLSKKLFLKCVFVQKTTTETEWSNTIPNITSTILIATLVFLKLELNINHAFVTKKRKTLFRQKIVSQTYALEAT